MRSPAQRRGERRLRLTLLQLRKDASFRDSSCSASGVSGGELTWAMLAANLRSRVQPRCPRVCFWRHFGDYAALLPCHVRIGSQKIGPTGGDMSMNSGSSTDIVALFEAHEADRFDLHR